MIEVEAILPALLAQLRGLSAQKDFSEAPGAQMVLRLKRSPAVPVVVMLEGVRLREQQGFRLFAEFLLNLLQVLSELFSCVVVLYVLLICAFL